MEIISLGSSDWFDFYLSLIQIVVTCILNHSRINSLSFFSVSGGSKDSFDSTVV